jgi:hypothetical protein
LSSSPPPPPDVLRAAAILRAHHQPDEDSSDQDTADLDPLLVLEDAPRELVEDEDKIAAAVAILRRLEQQAAAAAAPGDGASSSPSSSSPSSSARARRLLEILDARPTTADDLEGGGEHVAFWTVDDGDEEDGVSLQPPGAGGPDSAALAELERQMGARWRQHREALEVVSAAVSCAASVDEEQELVAMAAVAEEQQQQQQQGSDASADAQAAAAAAATTEQEEEEAAALRRAVALLTGGRAAVRKAREDALDAKELSPLARQLKGERERARLRGAGADPLEEQQRAERLVELLARRSEPDPEYE